MNKFLALLFACLPLAGLAQPVFPPATQSEVNAGTLTAKFVSPATLAGWTGGGGGTNFNGLLITNFIRYVGLDTGNNTNIVIPWDSTNAVVSSPSNNFTMTLSGTPPAGYYQKIPWTLVVTNAATTSAVFPLALINGDTPGIKTPPSTNTFVIVMDGARQFIEGGINPVNTNQFSTDGSSLKSGVLTTNHIFYGNLLGFPSAVDLEFPTVTPLGSGAVSAMDEEFWMNSNTAGEFGAHYWSRGQSGTAFATNTGVYAFGMVALVTRTEGGRVAVFPQSALANILLTNMQMRFAVRLQKSALDGGGSTNTMRAGFGDITSTEQGNGIYFRSTNNTWQLVTARASSRTVSSGTYPVTANQWTVLAAQLDATGTNVVAYVGTSETNLTAFATNSATIPNSVPVFPILFSMNGQTNTTDGFTNFVDYFKIHVKR